MRKLRIILIALLLVALAGTAAAARKKIWGWGGPGDTGVSSAVEAGPAPGASSLCDTMLWDVGLWG